MVDPSRLSGVICWDGRVWHIRLTGPVSPCGSMVGFERFARELDRAGLRALVLDARPPGALNCADEAAALGARLLAIAPRAFTMACLIGPDRMREAVDLSRSLRAGGLTASVFTCWQAAVQFAGVRTPVADPLSFDPGDVLELE